MRIALDAMGGDHAPQATVAGAVAAARELAIEVLLVGQPGPLEGELSRYDGAAGVSIVPASEVVAMDEPPAAAVRGKPDSSIAVAMRLVKDGKAEAFVSAGNTGACMAAGVLLLGRAPGVERPALGTVIPAAGGRRTLLVDAGANAENRAPHLAQFALMGRAYAERVLGIPDPSVGLLSIGEEAAKGNPLVHEAYQLLEALPGLRFVGNVEGRDIPRGVADVVVTDGFTGNVVLKCIEGTAEMLLQELRGAIRARLPARLGAALALGAFRELRRKLDYAEYGGAPMLGLRGVVIIGHGRSDARAVRNALRAARDAVDQHIVEAVTDMASGERA